MKYQEQGETRVETGRKQKEIFETFKLFSTAIVIGAIIGNVIAVQANSSTTAKFITGAEEIESTDEFIDRMLKCSEDREKSFKVKISNDVATCEELTDYETEAMHGVLTYNQSNYGYISNKMIDYNGWAYLEVSPLYATTEHQEEMVDDLIDDIVANWVGLSDYRKALLAHDLVCTRVTYKSDLDTKGHAKYRSAYDALLKGTAVCSGYSLLYSKILTKCGIDNYCYVNDDLSHEWNLVKIYGKWYQVDCTWDDTIITSHEYFLKGKDMICHDYTGDIKLSNTDYKIY